jgi:putative protease
MENFDTKMELLAPAGGPDQLAAAIAYGADAVYLATDQFGMRARASNFSGEELRAAVKLAHAAGVKVYVTCNILVLQNQMSKLERYFQEIDESGADALIIGDMGAFALAKKYAPSCELHVSTQASVANAEAARVWCELGAKRVVCAREMSLAEIAEMRAQVPHDLEIESFAHGAQCMAVSGRCLISSYMTGRSGNAGNCTQPCRWNYTLEEEKRPGQHYPVEETDAGTLLFNAKDLCMIDHLDELAQAGVSSIKIEGRNKKSFYVATVVGAYRRVLDGEAPANVLSELTAVSHRPYSTGFYFGPAEQACDYDGYEQETIHVADVLGSCPRADGRFDVWLRCRNRFAEGDTLEVLSPHSPTKNWEIADMCWLPEAQDTFAPTCAQDLAQAPFEARVAADVANRSCNIYVVPSDESFAFGSFLRRREYRRCARKL